MKKIILLLFLLVNMISYAQQDILLDIGYSGDCGVTVGQPQIKFTPAEINAAKSSVNDLKYVFNVKIHYLDNVVPSDEQEFKSLDIVGALNYKFNDNDIFFKYRGFDNISSDSNHDYSSIDDNDVGYLGSSIATDDNIDIFICNAFEDASGTSGVTYTWTNPTTGLITNKVIFIRYDYIPTFDNANPTNDELMKQTVIHEMGHYFGLNHTHQRWKYDNGTLVTVSDNYPGCDAIEENLDGSEALIYGDLIADTNPDRVRRWYWDGSNYYSNCTVYWNSYHDHPLCGNHIDHSLFNPPMENIMAYYHHCRDGFTQDQKDYMRAFIANYSNNGFLTNQLTDIQSLYEPYETGTPVVYQITYTAQANLAVGVPYYYTWYKHFGNKFQKGFDYEFYAWDPDNNSYNYDYSRQIFERPLDDFSYRAVKINQINQDIIVFESRENPVPGPLVTSSTIISSDVNTNDTTIRDLNTQESNDPNLIQNLETQKVHTIIKHLDNGEDDVKRIYKTD